MRVIEHSKRVAVHISMAAVLLTAAIVPVVHVSAAGETFTTPSAKTTSSGTPLAITDLQIDGTGNDQINVNLFVASGKLELGSTAGITVDDSTTDNNLQISGPRQAINSVLQTLTFTSDTDGSYTIDVRLGGGDGDVYNPANEHVYQVVQAPDDGDGGHAITWEDAKTAAEAMTYGGVSGYLATITSEQEHNFVLARINQSGWIGANDIASEKTWRWMTGPEAGTQFWYGDQDGSAVNGQFANWSPNEPNNTNGNEDCAQIWFGGSPGSLGKWNDLNCEEGNPYYVVEFGAPGVLPVVASTHINVTVTTEIIDGDNDGIDNAIEDAAPNDGDANNDGVKDSLQANVASFVSPVNNKYVAVELDDDCELTHASAATESASAKDAGYSYMAGLLNFSADCSSDSTLVQVYQHGVSANGLTARKFNPTNGSYFTIEGAAVSTVTVAGQNVAKASYTVADNGILDLDPAVGTISDPVGLGNVAVTAPNTGLGGKR